MILFDKNGIQTNQICPICSARPFYFYNQKYSLEKKSNRETELLLNILNSKEMSCKIALCPRCLHSHRFPLYQETRLYSRADAPQIFADAQKKYPDEKAPLTHLDLNLMSHEMAHAFYNLHFILKNLWSKPNFQIDQFKILDWGGGNGYLSGSIALMLNKKFDAQLKEQASVYIFDLKTDYRRLQGNESYLQYVDEAEIVANAPYDMIIFSHVLEHVANPLSYVQGQLKHLSPNGLVIIVVPYEQNVIFKPSNAKLKHHQQLFSVASIHTLLKKVGLGDIRVEMKKQLCGNYWIIASASQTPLNPKKDQQHFKYKLKTLSMLAWHVFLRAGSLLKRMVGKLRIRS